MSKYALTDVFPRTLDAHANTRHTELADKLKASLRCPGET
jgi:hypothetical protein